MPQGIQRAISEAVRDRLEDELGARSLLLEQDRLAGAQAQAQQFGVRLMTALVHELYPASREPGVDVAIEFGGDAGTARVAGALAFGAATAAVLAPHRQAETELACAIFNLGIGLVDGMCDEDRPVGRRFLDVIDSGELAGAAERPRARGWLRGQLPPVLAADAAAAFTADVIEAFFAVLQRVYADDASVRLRARVGEQIAAALEAERNSIDRRPDAVAREQLLAYSRATSVLPFEIIERLARADDAPAGERSAGTLLGEAMWRIDDLVDLCQDAQSGALNAVLLAADGGGGLAALQRLLDSTELADAAAEAADKLAAGLCVSGAQEPRDLFLQFIQRYTGIAS